MVMYRYVSINSVSMCKYTKGNNKLFSSRQTQENIMAKTASTLRTKEITVISS